jgi:hypothetical protein
MRGHRNRSGRWLCACAFAAVTQAVIATDVVLDARVVGAGGSTLSGGAWTLDATIAQPIVAHHAGAGGWQLQDGFWHALPAPGADTIFADGFDPAVLASLPAAARSLDDAIRHAMR